MLNQEGVVKALLMDIKTRENWLKFPGWRCFVECFDFFIGGFPRFLELKLNFLHLQGHLRN